jgi:hypothetical protein
MTSLTSTQVANEAIQLIGDNTPLVTGVAPNFDTSPAGVALAQIYAPTVAAVMRQFQWDQSRKTASLTLTGNTAPFPWSYEYYFPSDGVQVWQVAPASLTDPYDPLPVNWSVGNDVVSGSQVKCVFANIAGAKVIYDNNPAESTWDPLFTETVVRLLAAKLAMAIAGRTDTAQSLTESGAQFDQVAQGRGDV